ncbi:Alkyl hydroperoxide reductase/ thiol specific antioxidant/ Mal allergen [Hyella patelloides LEGE 07179]|uniref:Alkyl hydroperoxide reductase/ thiol specific antioxidant/ Mal allergen n=1 Tax=Hyella patelloides LEGE 07179 TaxID=945734 RepID=A0A563W0H1_9CYAN|nr:thioredoxin family protein [Hyella patelloides]VEP17117.1 Alkyl hydroperoxide reductase/ thiol specific antioxidant/ Mal allergen [Hyella patelloides LEGE 07179]
MVLTPSTMLPLGTQAPDFQLPDVVSGKTISLETFSDRQALLIIFMCRHCPFVKHVQKEFFNLQEDYAEHSLGILAISANDVAKYPDDSPESLKAMAQELGFKFPICYDATQEVSKAYTAACTPDFFLFDSNQQLVYRGQLDASRPSNGIPVTGQDLRKAIAATLENRAVGSDQKPSIGCNIKWIPGNEPEYFGATS